MKETKRRKLTPLGWVTMAVILAVFIAFIFLWIYPIAETGSLGTILTRMVVLFVVLAVVSGVAVALGRKRLFRE